MARIENWNTELRTWLSPFLEKLGHKARRQMCPLYLSGLIGPGDRKSVQPMAERFAPGDYDQLHHFVAAGVWDAAPLETELLTQADRLVGGNNAVLVIDDTAMPKKGEHSVGVAAQYDSALAYPTRDTSASNFSASSAPGSVTMSALYLASVSGDTETRMTGQKSRSVGSPYSSFKSSSD